MLKKEVVPLLLAVALLLFLPSAASATAPTPAEREQRMAYIRWKNTGLATTDFDFDPASVLTRGMAAEVFVRLLGLTERAELERFEDIAPDAPHYAALSKCVAAGIMGGLGGGRLAPEAEASHEMLALMISRALDVPEQEVSWGADGSLLAAATGYELLAALDRMIASYSCFEGAALSASGGLAVVAAPGITVSGSMERLVVAPGAGDGAVTLENALVSDSVTVHAPARVYLKDNTLVQNVVLGSGGTRARVVGDGVAVVVSVTSSVPAEARETPGQAAEAPPETEPEPDTAPDAEAEATPEAGTEPAADAGAETGTEAGAETGTGDGPEDAAEAMGADAAEPEAAAAAEAGGETPPEPEGVPYTALSIGPAAVVDQAAPETPPYEDYRVSAWEGGPEDAYDALICVEMRSLRPHRSPGAGAGYWTGFHIEAPEGAEGYRVSYSPTGENFGSMEHYALSGGGFSRFFDAARWREYYVMLQWTGAGIPEDSAPALFKVDFGGVELDTSSLTTADSLLGRIGPAALAPDGDGGAPYSFYGVTVENRKDENGGYFEIGVHAYGLKMHRSAAGAGYWAGFSIAEPAGAGSCRSSVYLSLDAAKQNFSGRTPLSWEAFSADVDGYGSYGIRQLTDASKPDQRDYWAVVQWYEDTAGSVPLTAAAVYHIVLDVHLAENTRNGAE